MPPQQVTVTMPIHPLKGLALTLIGTRREHRSRRQTLIAEAPLGGHIVLPVEWTDRGPPWVALEVNGRDEALRPWAARVGSGGRGSSLPKSWPFFLILLSLDEG